MEDSPCQDETYYNAAVIRSYTAVTRDRSVEQTALRQTPACIIIQHIIKPAFEISGWGMNYSIKDVGTNEYLFWGRNGKLDSHVTFDTTKSQRTKEFKMQVMPAKSKKQKQKQIIFIWNGVWGGFFRSVFGSFSLPRFFFCGLQVIHNIPMLILNWWHTHTFKSKISSVRFLGICNFLNKTRLPAYFGLTAPLRPPLTFYCSSHPFLSHSCLPLFGGCSAGCVCSGAPSVGSGISTFLHSENVLTLLFSERRLGFVWGFGFKMNFPEPVQIWLRHALEFRVADEKSDVVIVFVPSLLLGPFPSSCPCWTC